MGKDLKKGDKGAEVKKLQMLLNKGGADPKLNVDGIFGPKTERAVMNFRDISRDVRPGKTAGAAEMKAIQTYIKEAVKRERIEKEIESFKKFDYKGPDTRNLKKIDTQVADLDKALKNVGPLASKIVALEAKWRKLCASERDAWKKDRAGCIKARDDLLALQQEVQKSRDPNGEWPAFKKRMIALENEREKYYFSDVSKIPDFDKTEHELSQLVRALSKLI